MRILILEPYYGGSHQHFLGGLQSHVPADYVLLTLPARKWKMRMQLSAVWFVEQLTKRDVSDRHFDTVLCSTFVDVAVLRALLARVQGWNQEARILTYFHENQFAYPEQFKQPGQHQFTSINFHSALCSDSIAFNSSFNRESYLSGCRRILKVSSDMKFPGVLDELREKSCILYPGIDFDLIDKQQRERNTNAPVIVWNHRWEHDKNPDLFFDALKKLRQNRVDFRLIVLGQSFTNSPECFLEARTLFDDNIIHFGFADSYEQYAELLSKGDIVVSTSQHEFYGISIIEAVRAGCLPLLPDRLSYPELFDERFLYQDDLSFLGRLEMLIADVSAGYCLGGKEAKAMTGKFSWMYLKNGYAAWLLGNE